MADSPLLAIIEQLEEARLEFWDDDLMRAEAARFLLVARAYAAIEQLPPHDLLLAFKDLQLGDPGRIEAVRHQVSSLGSDDQAYRLALACLDADMQVHLLIIKARSSSSAGQFFTAAKQFRQAEEARRAMERQLQPAPDSEREVQHEWHDLAALYPDLAACMEDAFRKHATQTEPLQLAQAAITLAQVGDGAGAERALAIAARWTEGQGPTLPILEKLAGFLPRWPALQEAILQGPHDPIPALDQLASWIDDSERQMLRQLVSEHAPDIIAGDTLPAEIQRVVDDEWVAESQADMQTVLALRLTIAIAQENRENLEHGCQQIRASMKHLGATTILRQQLSLLQAWEEKRLSTFESSLSEIAPFVENPAVIGSEVVQSLQARIQLHQSILEQIKSLAGSVGPVIDAHPEETGTTDEATASPEEQEQGARLLAETMSEALPSSGGRGAVDNRNVLPGKNGPAQADRLADVYRSLRGMRFSEAADQLRSAGSSTNDGQERARIARLTVVTQACLAALDAGSNPSSQTVEDLIQAAGCLEADRGLDAASTWLDWSNQACPVLDDSGVRMLRREIEVRRAFRSVDQLLAQGRFSEAPSVFPGASQENNGLNSGSPGSDFWREVMIDWSKSAEQKKGLLKPIHALKKLQEASEAALDYTNSRDVKDALSRLAGPLQEAAKLKEPDAHGTFHPLAFWLNRVLAAWRDVQAIEAASQPGQSLLVIQQTRLICDHAKKATLAADFDDSLEPFNALVNKLDDEIHNRRRSMCDSLLGQLSGILDSDVSLTEVDRRLSSIFACLWDSVDRRSVLDALGQRAIEQTDLGDRELVSKPNDIEQLSRAAPFYQRARLLGLLETVAADMKATNAISSLTKKLEAVTEKALHIRKLQAEYDAARANQQYDVARRKVEEASEAGASLKEGGSLDGWDYVVKGRAVIDEVVGRRTAREARLRELSNYSMPAHTMEN